MAYALPVPCQLELFWQGFQILTIYSKSMEFNLLAISVLDLKKIVECFPISYHTWVSEFDRLFILMSEDLIVYYYATLSLNGYIKLNWIYKRHKKKYDETSKGN